MEAMKLNLHVESVLLSISRRNNRSWSEENFRPFVIRWFCLSACLVVRRRFIALLLFAAAESHIKMGSNYTRYLTLWIVWWHPLEGRIVIWNLSVSLKVIKLFHVFCVSPIKFYVSASCSYWCVISLHIWEIYGKEEMAERQLHLEWQR